MFKIILLVAGIVGFTVGWITRQRWGLYKTHQYFKRIQKEREMERLQSEDTRP